MAKTTEDEILKKIDEAKEGFEKLAAGVTSDGLQRIALRQEAWLMTICTVLMEIREKLTEETK